MVYFRFCDAARCLFRQYFFQSLQYHALLLYVSHRFHFSSFFGLFFAVWSVCFSIFIKCHGCFSWKFVPLLCASTLGNSEWQMNGFLMPLHRVGRISNVPESRKLYYLSIHFPSIFSAFHTEQSRLSNNNNKKPRMNYIPLDALVKLMRLMLLRIKSENISFSWGNVGSSGASAFIAVCFHCPEIGRTINRKFPYNKNCNVNLSK